MIRKHTGDGNRDRHGTRSIGPRIHARYGPRDVLTTEDWIGKSNDGQAQVCALDDGCVLKKAVVGRVGVGVADLGDRN